MKKQDKLLYIIFAAIFVCGLGYACLSRGSETRLAQKIQAEGIATDAAITAVRRHLPPKGTEGYGDIVYEYRDRTGSVHQGKQSVSEPIFERFQYEKTIEILYAPDKPRQSRVALSLEAATIADEAKTDLERVLHDIWALETLHGETMDPAPARTPVLELHVRDMRVVGNDGCNQISGSLEALGQTNLKFGPLASTRKACPNMQSSYAFSKALSEVRAYKREGLKLFLLNADGRELLQLKKVD